MEIKEKNRKVLVVDDNQTNLALIKVYLEQMGLEVYMAQEAHSGLEIAMEERPDLILLDIMMPVMDGIEMCKRLKADPRTVMIPVIFVTAKDQSQDKISGLKSGAVDYITKPFNPNELKTRINVILQMIELQEKLLDQANTDELTGLANRRHFFKLLEREILQSEIKGTNLTIIMIDVDHFKSINDNYGHLGGDAVLKQMANIIRENIYPLDVAARYGGEEFVILMPSTPADIAYQAAEKLRRKIETCNWKISADHIKITASMGVTTMDNNILVSSYDLIKRADNALYMAKREGRNRVVVWKGETTIDLDTEDSGQNIYKLKSQVSHLAEQLKMQALGTVTALAKTLEARDPFTANQAEHVQIYVNAIAEQMNLSHDQNEQICNAALLHDLGMIGIPDEILSKIGDLSQDERETIKQHPIIGAQILNPIGFFEKEVQIIRHHHENYDGTGYPDHLKAKKIPFGARVLAVAIAFDAMTSDRWHREALTRQQALDEIQKCSGKQFDPEIVSAFLNACVQAGDLWPLSEIETFNAANCWEVNKCERIPKGKKSLTQGICPAYPHNGKHCWETVGTMASTPDQHCPQALELGDCTLCNVYRRFRYPLLIRQKN